MFTSTAYSKASLRCVHLHPGSLHDPGSQTSMLSPGLRFLLVDVLRSSPSPSPLSSSLRLISKKRRKLPAAAAAAGVRPRSRRPLPAVVLVPRARRRPREAEGESPAAAAGLKRRKFRRTTLTRRRRRRQRERERKEGRKTRRSRCWGRGAVGCCKLVATCTFVLGDFVVVLLCVAVFDNKCRNYTLPHSATVGGSAVRFSAWREECEWNGEMMRNDFRLAPLSCVACCSAALLHTLPSCMTEPPTPLFSTAPLVFADSLTTTLQSFCF